MKIQKKIPVKKGTNMKQTSKVIRYTVCFEVPVGDIWNSNIECVMEELHDNIGATIVNVEILGSKTKKIMKKKIAKKVTKKKLRSTKR